MATRKAPTKRASTNDVRRTTPTSAEVSQLSAEATTAVARAVTRAAAQGTAVAARGVSRDVPVGTKTNLVSELNSIDFRKMIGGPLQAAVDAQVASSLATVDFIQKVGFEPADPNVPDGPRKLVMANFTHSRDVIGDDGKPSNTTIKLEVPLLAMLPIPSLRIEHVIIDFNVKLNAVESSTVSDDLGVNAEVKGGWGPVSFKVSASYQRKTTTNVEVKKEYSLNVNVKAVQDELPAGLERVLGMISA